MAIKSRLSTISILFLLSIFSLSLSPCQSAPPPKFNIFQYLSAFPEYSGFVELLNKTRLAQDLMTREQVTVLVVRNENLGGVIPNQRLDVLQPLLCSHVLLEFMDSTTFQGNRVKFPHEVVTLYQTTGVADGLQGRVNIYRTPNAFLIGSAVKGVRPSVKFVKTVRESKYTRSVMEVTGFIITPGISDDILPPPAAPLPAPTPKNTTKGTEDVEASAPADGPAADEVGAPADGPAEDADSPVDSPAESPKADSPTTDAPAADEKNVADKDDDNAPSPSSAGRLFYSVIGGAFVGGMVATAFSL